MMGMMGRMGAMHGTWGWAGCIWMVLLWAAILGGVIWLVSTILQRRPQSTAANILAERYARGELTREQYTAMLADLRYAGPRKDDNGT